MYTTGILLTFKMHLTVVHRFNYVQEMIPLYAYVCMMYVCILSLICIMNKSTYTGYMYFVFFTVTQHTVCM